MRFFSALTLAAGASAAAVSINGRDVSLEPKKCLCKSDVEELSAVYAEMLDNWDDKLIKYLHKDFTDRSDSINTLIPNGPPPGVPIFNKETFIQHQHEQPDDLPVKIERLGPFNCNSFSFVWTATFKKFSATVEKVVRGVTIIETEKVDGQWQFKSFDVEFNNINFLLAIGGSVTPPPPPPSS
jgi:hypothetical protein